MTLDSWKQGRIHHVLAAKQQDGATCHTTYGSQNDGCVQWAWQHLDECVCGTVQITGWALILLAIVFFIPASCSTKKAYTHTTRSSSPSPLGLSLTSLFISVIGLTGAIISMQMALVIAFDATVAMVDLGSVIVVVGGRVLRCHKKERCDHPSKQLSNGCQSQTASKNDSISVWKFLCYSGVSLAHLTLIVCALQGIQTVGTSRDLQVPGTRDFKTDSRTTGFHEVLMVVGYAMGSLACFGRWAFHWNTIRFKGEFPGESMTFDDSKMTILSRAVLVLSRFLYVIGVLLQSGGWMVVMVTLPWTVKSFIGACAECYEMVLSLRHRHYYRKVNDTDDDSDVITLTESGSDTSNILWDRAWKDRTDLDEFPYYQKTKPKYFDVQALRLLSNISSTSDLSSSSDEQELEWENANIAPYNPPAKERKIRIARIMNCTPPRILPLTLTMPESSDQRIITWISNSTPEEEKSPTLTMALNLDHHLPQTQNDHSMVTESRTFPHVLPPRKYSL